MTERYDQDNILGYVEGELSDEQRAGFEAVLAEDHELRQLVSQMKLDRQALRGLGSSRAPVGLIEQVIQTNERSALLGDPAAPEPLQLTAPASRWTFRRAAAYGAIAAVLIVSFGLVFQTLIPPGMLTKGTHYAQHEADTNPTDTPVPDAGAGVALLDEDSVYDAAGLRSLGRKRAKESVDTITPSSAAEAFIPEPAAAETLGQLVEAEGPPAEGDAVEFITDPKAVADATDGADTSVSGEELAGTFADTSTGSSAVSSVGRQIGLEEKTDEQYAKADPVIESEANRSKNEVSADAFAGYGVEPGIAPTQLVVNSPSPMQAQRDIRDWALANSVRLVEEPGNESSRAYAYEGRAAGGYGGSGTSAGVAGLSAGGQAGSDRGQFGDPLNDTTIHPLQKQTRGNQGAAIDTPPTGPATTSYVVLIDQDQVPSLLGYLNRTQGQRAELIAPATEALARVEGLASVTDGAPYERSETREHADTGSHRYARKDSGTEGADVEEKEDAPKATANRLVDTESGWFDSNTSGVGRSAPLVRGLSASPSSDTARQSETQKASAEQYQEHEEPAAEVGADTADDRSIKHNEPSPDRSRRQHSYFDWSRLLDPRRPSNASSPVSPPAEHASDESPVDPARGTQLRLQVIIQQTADDNGAEATPGEKAAGKPVEVAPASPSGEQ